MSSHRSNAGSGAGSGGDPDIGIVELGDVCAAMEARHLDLFEITGAWVFDAVEPAAQRAFAEASHRHAWHAELWARRCPAIPPVDHDRLVAAHRRPAGDTGLGSDDDARTAAHRQWLEELVAGLDDLTVRIVPELDPSTARVITLVRSDLVDLLDR